MFNYVWFFSGFKADYECKWIQFQLITGSCLLPAQVLPTPAACSGGPGWACWQLVSHQADPPPSAVPVEAPAAGLTDATRSRSSAAPSRSDEAHRYALPKKEDFTTVRELVKRKVTFTRVKSFQMAQSLFEATTTDTQPEAGKVLLTTRSSNCHNWLTKLNYFLELSCP